MEKLKTQEVWKDARLWPQYPQKENQGNEITAFQAGYKAAMEKLSNPNMILISPEELEARERKIAEEAWKQGYKSGFNNGSNAKTDSHPTKEQYINSLFK